MGKPGKGGGESQSSLLCRIKCCSRMLPDFPTPGRPKREGNGELLAATDKPAVSSKPALATEKEPSAETARTSCHTLLAPEV